MDMIELEVTTVFVRYICKMMGVGKDIEPQQSWSHVRLLRLAHAARDSY